MFAPRKGTANRSSKGQHAKSGEVVFCEGSSLPLAIPNSLIAGIREQINDGLRAHGAEIGGLLLARNNHSGGMLADAVVPIATEYRFGRSFQLSPTDIRGMEALLADLQKDPSKKLVGFYRSRTQQDDNASEEAQAAVLSALENAHSSFATDFRYFVVFTPLSKLVMTASATFRKEEGWADWQHVWLVTSATSSSGPVDFGASPAGSPAADSPVQQSPAFTAEAPPSEPLVPSMAAAITEPRPTPPPLPGEEARYSAAADAKTTAGTEWISPSEAEARTPSDPGTAKLGWYPVAGVLLVIALMVAYVRTRPKSELVTIPARVSVIEAPPIAAPSRTTPRTTGFQAAREGSLWRLRWDDAAAEALHPTGAVLSIRDDGKEQRVDLSVSDLSRGTIYYEPNSDNLFFSLTILMPGGQFAEEHVRVLGGQHDREAVAQPASKVEAPNQVRTIRPFAMAAIEPKDSSAGSRPVADVPSPPVLAAAPTQIPRAEIPIGPAAPAPAASAAIVKPAATPEPAVIQTGQEFVPHLAGSWKVTVSQSPFAVQGASVAVEVVGGELNAWFRGNYKIPRNGPSFKQPVNFEFRGNLTSKLPDGAWQFPFQSDDGLQGTIKLRPQGNTLDVTWKASLPDGKTYTFEHVMSRETGK